MRKPWGVVGPLGRVVHDVLRILTSYSYGAMFGYFIILASILPMIFLVVFPLDFLDKNRRIGPKAKIAVKTAWVLFALLSPLITSINLRPEIASMVDRSLGYSGFISLPDPDPEAYKIGSKTEYVFRKRDHTQAVTAVSTSNYFDRLGAGILFFPRFWNFFTLTNDKGIIHQGTIYLATGLSALCIIAAILFAFRLLVYKLLMPFGW